MSILKYMKWFIVSLAVVVLTACGGGGSGGDELSSDRDVVQNTVNVNGVAQLGYIAGGTVSLYEVSDLDNPIATTTTDYLTDIEKAGRFSFEDLELDENAYYLLSVTGGEDIDADDNGVADDTSTPVEGTVHALVSGKELKAGVRINAFTDMAYEKIQANIKTMSGSNIKESLNTSAKEYLFDINGDDTVDYLDMHTFDPVDDKDKTKASYRQILDIYIPNIHTNTAKSKKLSALMYLDSPQIVVENGRLQEVPFSLKTTLENVPKGLDVKWFVNNEEQVSINTTIDMDGIYKISAKVYAGEELLKTVTTNVIATNKVEIASVQASTDESSEIIVTTESNSSLAGTQVYIPAGALKEDTKIVVKKASVNGVPSDNSAISLSDVLVLQPSGLIFDKPVQIRLPYDENLDLTDKTIRIARYSDGGQIDYLTPLYVDKEKYEVVFETEHFTEFELQTNYGFEKKKAEQSEIQDIQSITGITEYDNDKWEEILNTNIINDDTTIYDLYLKYKLHTKIIDYMNQKDYKQAYDIFVENEDTMIQTGEMWESIAKTYEVSVDTTKTYKSVKSNLKTLFITKKYYSQIASNLGIVTDMNPMSFVTDYTTYVFKQAIDIISLADNINKKDAFGLFFSFREKNPAYTFDEIFEELEKSRESKQGGLALFDNSDYPIYRGWFGNNLYTTGTLAYQSNKSYYYSLNALWELRENFNKKTDAEHKQALKDIIEEIAYFLKLEEVEDDKYVRFNSRANGFIEYQKNEKVNIDFSMSNYGYSSDISLLGKVYDANNNLLIDSVSINCRMENNENGLYKECKDNIDIDTGLLNGNEFIKLKAYSRGTFVDTYLDTDLIIHLREAAPKIHVTITRLKVNGNLQEDGSSYTVAVTPEFDISAKPPVDVAGSYNGKTLGTKFVILKNDFDDYKLQNIPFTVSLKESVKGAYTMQTFNTEIDVKSLLDQALLDREGNVEPTDVSAPELVATSSRDIYVGDTVTFSVDRTNLASVIKRNFHGSVRKQVANNSDIYTVTYNTKGLYYPSMLIELTDGRRETIYAKRVVVGNLPSDEETNIEPAVAPYQYENIASNVASDIHLNASDTDGDTLTSEYSQPSHGMVTGNGLTVTYTPDTDYVGSDRFTYKVKDGKGGVSKEATVYVTVIEVKPAEIREVSYHYENDPKDTCSNYSDTGCEKVIERGTSFAKEWQIKNIGNVNYSGLRVVPVTLSSDTELQVSVSQEFPDSLAINAVGSYKLQVTVPENVKAGAHKALYKLVDANGDLYYSNGNKAYIWYKFIVEEELILKEDGIPQNLKAEQQDRSIFLDWDDVGGAQDYTLYYSLNDIDYMSLADSHEVGCGYEGSSYMLCRSDITEMYFKVQADDGKLSESIYFVWEDIEESPLLGLLGGKTFYDTNAKWIAETIFNADLTSAALRLTEDGVFVDYGTDDLRVEGEKLFVNESFYMVLVEETNDYLLFNYFDLNGNIGGSSRWYFDEAKARAYFESLATPVTLESLVVGNTFYMIIEGHRSSEGLDSVYKKVFSDDGIVSTTEDGYTFNDTYYIENNKIYIDTGFGTYLIVKNQYNDFIEIEEIDDYESRTLRFYFDKTKADAYIATLGSSQTASDLSALIVGKTFYQHCQDNGSEWIATITFGADGTITIVDNGKSEVATYRIEGNTLYENDSGFEKAHILIENTVEYIQFDGEAEGAFYVTSALAQASPAIDCGGDSGDYSVYGGNTYFSGGLSNMEGYTFLGKAQEGALFYGTYKYYVVVNENASMSVKIDAVEGSNGTYYGTYTTSNTGDTWMNLLGIPDNNYVSIGGYGYILIDASSDSLSYINVYGSR